MQFVGSLHADFVHLNDEGHTMWADLAEGLLAPNANVLTWKHVPDLIPPSVASFAANVDPIITTATGPLTLTANGVADPEGQPITAVKFYIDSNHNGSFDVSDTLIGAATNQGNGAWQWSGSAALMPVGSQRIITVPYDVNNQPGTVRAVLVNVFQHMPGDANLDDVTNFKDYIILEGNFGKSGMGWSGGDFNSDGITNFQDYIMLESYFNKRVNSAPEQAPGSAPMALAAAPIVAATATTATATVLLDQLQPVAVVWPARAGNWFKTSAGKNPLLRDFGPSNFDGMDLFKNLA